MSLPRYSWLPLLLVALPLILALLALGPQMKPTRTHYDLVSAGGAALALAEQSRDPEDALQAAELLGRAVVASPDDAGLRQRLARAYTIAGQYTQAATQLENAWRIRPDGTSIQLELAEAYEQIGRLDEADTVWRTLGLRAPQMRRISQNYRDIGDLQQMQRWVERAERND